MTPERYLQAVLRTANVALRDPLPRQRERYCAGLVGEAGEIVEVCKKVAHHGTLLEPLTLARELGDLWWYIGLAHLVEHWDFSSTYGEVEDRIRRDTGTEQSVLRLALDLAYSVALATHRALDWRAQARFPYVTPHFYRLTSLVLVLEQRCVPDLDIWEINNQKLLARWPLGFSVTKTSLETPQSGED